MRLDMQLNSCRPGKLVRGYCNGGLKAQDLEHGGIVRRPNRASVTFLRWGRNWHKTQSNALPGCLITIAAQKNMVGGDSPLPSVKAYTENSQVSNHEMPQTEVEPSSDAGRLCFCFCMHPRKALGVCLSKARPQALRHTAFSGPPARLQVPKPCMHVGTPSSFFATLNS